MQTSQVNFIYTAPNHNKVVSSIPHIEKVQITLCYCIKCIIYIYIYIYSNNLKQFPHEQAFSDCGEEKPFNRQKPWPNRSDGYQHNINRAAHRHVCFFCHPAITSDCLFFPMQEVSPTIYRLLNPCECSVSIQSRQTSQKRAGRG